MTTAAEAVAELITELSASLADLVSAIEGQAKDSNEIKVVLKQIAQAMSRNKGADEIASALRSLRLEAPAIEVHVSPTPIQNIVQPSDVIVQMVERSDEVLINVEYDRFERISNLRLRRVPAKP